MRRRPSPSGAAAAELRGAGKKQDFAGSTAACCAICSTTWHFCPTPILSPRPSPLQQPSNDGGLTAEEHVDFLSYLLRQLGRHLTAYDLVTFHHQGANYPDMLLLDLVLKVFLQQVEERPSLFEGSPADDSGGGGQKRLRRRALRQGWILRGQYEGHPVPDAPTSPGEMLVFCRPPTSACRTSRS